MSPSIKLIHEQPNVENTILYHAYRASSPARFSSGDDDKFIMYGGSGSCSIISGTLRNFTSDQCSIFVLSSCFIIWSETDGLGFEIPYQSIYLHALDDTGMLYLQIENNRLHESDENTVELRLLPNQEDSSSLSNPLFREMNGGALDIYHAMNTCSAMHPDPDDENEEEEEHSELPLAIPSNWLEKEFIANSGQADDLNDYEIRDGHAGMSVGIGYGPIAGIKRDAGGDERAGSGLPNKRNRTLQ
ncbi:low temperature responsive protein [Lodderomyces elongisporus]|uniref:low temperature responsive protein n=1 Tax=Lodderomyces elongisporus TaxID=36914 RepID=UPI0029256AA3|nr:low temperature responsive protein [Lodderomyces elongisporus]WLF77607.1 low temperature responsive protein [Lodderomyces elongisporus]